MDDEDYYEDNDFDCDSCCYVMHSKLVINSGEYT